MAQLGPYDPRRPVRRPRGWIAVVLMLAMAALLAYRGWQRQQQPAVPQPPPATSDQPLAAPAAKPAESSRSAAPTAARAVIRDQTIRGLDGEVAYAGDVDIGPTLARIRAGRKLPFPNDGTTFQNRERRLPQKPAGYYKEYVHKTPGLPGPGPQRIVVGKEGETYYTADHYRTFRRVHRRP